MSSSGLQALELCLGARARSVAPPSPPPLLPPSPPSPPPLHPPHALISHAVQVAMNQIDAVGVVYRAQLDELKNKKLNHTEMLSQGQEHHKKARAELDRLLSPFRPDEMLHRAKVASTSGSRPRSRSPAGKGKDNGKSMDKDKGMDKGKDKGKGMGKGMDKGKVSLELQRASAVLELRQKMEHVFCRAQGKTLAALQLEVLDAVTPLLEQQVNYALTDIE
jgi:hypothetical protein